MPSWLPLPQAVEQKRKADEITAVLYPNDATEEGKELRLKQQFFFVSASLQDTIARYLVGWPGMGRGGEARLGRAGQGCPLSRTGWSADGRGSDASVSATVPVGAEFHVSLPAACLVPVQEKHSDLSGLPEKACFQMNDTHPTIAGEARLPSARACSMCFAPAPLCPSRSIPMPSSILRHEKATKASQLPATFVALAKPSALYSLLCSGRADAPAD